MSKGAMNWERLSMNAEEEPVVKCVEELQEREMYSRPLSQTPIGQS